jgi:hypothetical protein
VVCCWKKYKWKNTILMDLGYEKLPDLMIEESINERRTEDTGWLKQD